MQVGLIITGHLRSFEACAITLQQHVILPITNKDYTVKVFIDTWNTLGGVPQHDGDAVEVSIEDKLETINVLYNNPILRIEEGRTFECTKYNDRHGCFFTPANALSMFYKIQRGFELYKDYSEESGWVADTLIKCRPDLFFLSDLSTDAVESLGCIWTPDFGDFGGMNDQFGLGPPELMQHFFNTYENIDRMFDSGTNIHPETLLKRNIEDNKVSVGKTHIRYDLMRTSGQFTRQWS